MENSLKRYKSHKIVQAAKIWAIGDAYDADGKTSLYLDEGKAVVYVDKEWIERHRPQVCGYFVQYEDGYQSWSPAEAFEGGYTELKSRQTVTRTNVCGVDCHPGEWKCNGYCTGAATYPTRYEIELLNFGEAVEAVKKGEKVARLGWNGKGMWIALGKGDTVLAKNFWNPHSRAFAEKNGGQADVQPYFLMKTAQDNIQMGWTPSQSDVLAEDWVVVE